MLFRRSVLLYALALSPLAYAAGKAQHVMVVVWDGMRPDFISREHTPALYEFAREGVMFENHHAVYCSSTEVNGTAIATGAYPEHSIIIANRDYLPDIDPLKAADTQSRQVVRAGDELTGGKYLLRPTVAEILRAAGKSTAIAGTKEVALLHDRAERPPDSSSVNLSHGRTLPGSALEPIRKLLGNFPPDVITSNAAPNEPRDEWTTRALLGSLWSNGVPAFSLLWLSEPDFSQHAAGPGSPKALAALESSDRKLAAVLAELDRRGIRGKTDVFIVSDHGFSTAERFVDVCNVLRDAGFPAFREFKSPPKNGEILVTGQGASVLFHIIGHDAKTARKLVNFLQQQDFTGVVFTRKKMPGTFSLKRAKINSARAPDVAISMRWSAHANGFGAPGMIFGCGTRKPGYGLHGSVSPFDMHNTLVGGGPDLKRGFRDSLPTGNIDLAPTILWLLGVEPSEPMDGRVLSEALVIDAPKAGKARTRKLEIQRDFGQLVWHQYLQISRVNKTIYLDEGNGWTTAK